MIEDMITETETMMAEEMIETEIEETIETEEVIKGYKKVNHRSTKRRVQVYNKKTQK